MTLEQTGEDKLCASLDEVGRGSLAGPVVAAAVIWKPGPCDDMINDSKKLSKRQRVELAEYIKDNAIDYAVSFVDNTEIDRINILNATMKAMHQCLDELNVDFDKIMVDGNYFRNYKDKPHTTVVKGDGKYVSIAAASILAKVTRDAYMIEMEKEYPGYGWDDNMGYGSASHILAIKEKGITPLHRVSFLGKINASTSDAA